MRPQVSICIPTYNQGKYLAIAVRSALNQDLESLEVVVSDNHSTDETSAVLAGFGDERLRVVRPDRHVSMAENFDVCVRAGTGRYVTVLCSDDRLLPNYARIMAEALDKYQTATVAYSAAYILDEDRATRHVERHLGGSFCRRGSEELKRFLRGAGCVFPTMMMRRDAYDRTGGFYDAGESGREQASVIDWDIQLRLLCLGDVAYVDGVLAEFRVWSSKERAGRLLRLIEDTVRLYDTRIEEVVTGNPELREDVEEARRTRALVLAFGLNQLGQGAEFQEGLRLILKMSDSAIVRWMVRLESHGMAGLFAGLFHLYENLRWIVKGSITWCTASPPVEDDAELESVQPAPDPADDETTSGILRVTNGVLANLLGQVITAVGQLVLIPVFLGFWGQQLYGEWLSLSAAVTYLSMLDFGMQTYLVNRLNQAYVRGQYKEHSRMLHSALLFSIALSVSAMVLMVVILSLVRIEKWFVFAHTTHRTAALVEVLLCTQVVGAIPFGLISGCYRSIREYARGQMVNNVRTLVSIGLTALVIMAGRGLAAVAAAQLIVLVACAIWVCVDLRLRHREIRIGLSEANMRQAISFLGPSGLFFLIQAAAALTIQGSTLMVSALFGAASVAAFVPLRTLANLVRQMVGVLHSALWPEVTALETAHQYEALRNVHLMTSKVVVIGSACAAMILHFRGPEILALWTHHGKIFDPHLLDAFLVLLVSQSPWLTSSLVLVASNNHRRLSICYFASAAVGLGLGFLAARRFGMVGIVYGMCVGEYLACGWIIVRTACRLMGESVLHFVANVLGRAVPCCILLYAMVSGLDRLLPDGPGIVPLMSLALVAILLSFLLGVFICFDRRERSQIGRAVLATLRGWQILPAEEG